MSRRKKNRRTSPAAAAVLLVVCAGVALFSLRGQLGGAATTDNGPAGAFVDDPAVEDVGVDTISPGVDLLLQHGSWSGKDHVRMVFASLGASQPAAAPAGETARLAPPWVGADPPTMHLGVLMVGDTVRRAVVDGRVVGLGDKIGRAMIVAIERDTMTATWGGKRLTYDLDDDQPREFRAELKRRGGDQDAATTKGANEQTQENAK